MKDELLALAERCERAEGPDRELDAEIAVAVLGGEIVWKTANYTMEQYPARRYASEDHIGGYGNAPVEQYSASLDAAMALVPKETFWRLGHDGAGADPSDFRADVLWFIWPIGPKASPHQRQSKAIAATPALALTAACLRARAQGDEA